MRQTNDLLSAHARYAQRTATACGYEFRSLDGGDGYLFEVRDSVRKAVFAAGQGSPYVLNDANAASIARDKAFCARVLAESGVSVIGGAMFFVTERWAEMRAPGREPNDALAFASRASYPLFCKPITASSGQYAETIADEAAFADYMRRVAREHFAILVQPYFQGDEYRVFVLEGRALFSYRKRAPEIVGDGARTLTILAEREGVSGSGANGRLIGADDIPALGERVTLQGAANRALGGGADSFVDGAPASLADLALKAARAIGLKLAGVDIFDISPRRDLSDLVVIEVNSNPMIATLEDQGRWDLIETIWRANFNAALR